MKKVYAAIALLALILLIGYAESRSVSDSAGAVLELVEKAEKARGSEFFERCEEASEKWAERRPTLELFLSHTGLDDADFAAARMTEYAGAGDDSHARAALREFRTRMEALQCSEELSIYNLM